MPFIETKRLFLRGLEKTDADGPYHRWMNDPEIMQYLESRYFPHSKDGLASYIDGASDGRNLVLAICLRDGAKHIGNIKLGPIDVFHRRADIGLLLGEKSEWGKGYATEAIAAITAFAFAEMNLEKVTAGCYAGNVGSARAFERAGFVVEGTLRRHYFAKGAWFDKLLLAKFRA